MAGLSLTFDSGSRPPIAGKSRIKPHLPGFGEILKNPANTAGK